MQRIVSIWLPLWPIERMRRAQRPRRSGAGHDGRARDHRPGVPFALVSAGTHGLVLSAVNASARREGLRPGLALADARAAFPRLKTRAAEPERDRAALETLVLWCGRYGPRRNCQGPDGHTPDGNSRGSADTVLDGIWIDITGVAHLYGDEAALLADLHRRMTAFGLTVRLGLADTFGAAFALARYGDARGQDVRRAPIAAAGATRQALAGLPVEALRLPETCVVLLRRLGLYRIGQLYDLPRQGLALRFRQDIAAKSKRRTPSARREQEIARLAGIVLTRLDQALGVAAEPLLPIEDVPPHVVRRSFAEPLISAEGVESAAAGLAADLTRRLADEALGSTRFTLRLYRADGSSGEVRAGLSRPSRNAAHVMQLVAERLAEIDAGFGIDVMTLSADQVEALSEQQSGLPACGLPGKADAATLVDRLAGRLGPERVLRMASTDSHIPERAGHLRPAMMVDAGGAPAPPFGGLLRPPLLLPRPERICVMAEVPDGPPLRFTWRRLIRRVVRADGPERIAPEWWRSIGHRSGQANARTRDYYTIEDASGARFWVFRDGGWGDEEDVPEIIEAGENQQEPAVPVWFMHGVLA